MHSHKTLRLMLAALLVLTTLPGAAFAAPDSGGAPGQRSAAAQHGPTLPPQAQLARPRASEGHVVFRLRAGAGQDGVKAVAAAVGAKPSAVHAVRGAIRTLSLPAGVTVDEAVAALKSLPAVEWVEPDYAGEPLVYTPPLWSAPNDPSWTSTETWTFYSDPPTNTVVRATYANGRSWWLHDLNMPTAWQLGYTGPDIDGKHPLKASGEQIKIAVLDSGLYSTHPDLGTIVPGWDMCASYTNATGIATTDSDITPEDPAAIGNSIVVASHGTAVSGEIAAAVNNATGVTGASWDGKVVVYKIAGPQTDSGSGYPAGAIMWMDSVCAAAIMRAADEGARVISISAGWMSSQALQDAVNYAHTKGSMVVAAAGNNGYTNLILYPASADNVIAVGSYGLDAGGLRLRSSFSNSGSRMDIVAPGEYVWGLYKPDQSGVLTETGYSRWTGTSMSTPIVSALMAMLWRAAPGLSADEVWQYMRTTTDHNVQTSAGFYSNVWNSRTGYGAINPTAAYQALIADYPILTSPTVGGPSPSGAHPKITWSAVAGRDVTYDISVDGTPVASGLTTTTVQLTGLASGDHTVTVTPRSAFNWSDSTSVGSFSWTAFAEGPVITSFAWTGTSLTWSDAKPTTSTHYLSIDGGTTMTVVPESFTPTGLVTGVHTARLRVEDPLGNFDEKSLTFRAGPPPSVSTLTWNGSLLNWTDSETLAHTHYLSFDGSAPQPMSGHSFAPTGLATGVHSVRLRVTDPLGNYAEKTLAFRFGPAPTITSLTWDHTSLAWTDSETLAHTHYLSIDGGTTRTVSGHGFTPTGLATGAHTARVRVVDSLGNYAEKTLPFYAGTPVIARIGGSDRYRVAAAVSATGFATASRVVLVSGIAWPDAISAAPLARAMNAPVLATRGDLLSPAAAAEISRLRATRVTIVGGTGSVSDAVAAQLRRRGLAVDRVAGADRYETAARVAARLVAWRGSIESSTAIVVSGERFNDGIAAGAVAARKGWPLLLTRAGSVPRPTSRALTSMRAARTIVVGTPTRVGNGVLGTLPNPVRIAGATDASVPGALDTWARATYPTAFPGTSYAIVSANASADGLTAASYASGSGTIVLLTPWSLNLDTAKVIAAGRGRITKVVIIGGPASVSPDTEQLLAPYVTP